MKTTLPFAGFYQTEHADAVDTAYDHLIKGTEDTSCPNSAVIFAAICWPAVFSQYAKNYTEQFAHTFSIAISFEKLISPREYNFQTDQIFCTIEDAEVLRVFSLVDPALLRRQIKKCFTSRSGFLSFYSSDLSDWASNVLTWDHNQIAVLLEAFINSYIDVGELWEKSIAEALVCSNHIDDFLWNAIEDPQVLKMLRAIHTQTQS